MVRRGAAAAMLALILTQPVAAVERPTLLDATIARLEAVQPGFGAAGRLSLTVIRLDTRQRGSLRGDALVKAGSSNKVVWVAAALRARGVDAVRSIGPGALWASSNESAAVAIDRAGGIDRINRYVRGLGLEDLIAYEWNFGEVERVARGYPGPLRGNNTATTDDLARFWELVAIGWAIQGPERAALLEWSRGLKRHTEGSRLVARLPPAVADNASFKMGWLPIGREYELGDDETGFGGEPGGTTLILEGNAVDVGGGIVRLPDGRAYVIAVAAYDGTSWRAMTGWVEYASCVVYAVLAEDAIDCVRSTDPIGIRERRAVPEGALEAVASAPGGFRVSGWAVDPDAWWSPTTVAVSLDGVLLQDLSAMPAGVEDLFAPRFDHLFAVDLNPGDHEVCAVARNDGNGADTPLGCRHVRGS